MEDEDVSLTQELGFKSILSMPFQKQVAKEMIESILEYENNIDPK